mgnify:CR=1 FL=1
MCKSLIAEILKKKEEADRVNSLPDNQDMQRVTGLSLEDFGTIEGALSAYQFGMDCLFQAGDAFAVRCTLFSNLNLVNYDQAKTSILSRS